MVGGEVRGDVGRVMARRAPNGERSDPLEEAGEVGTTLLSEDLHRST
jgi:hypothetical protein